MILNFGSLNCGNLLPDNALVLINPTTMVTIPISNSSYNRFDLNCIYLNPRKKNLNIEFINTNEFCTYALSNSW